VCACVCVCVCVCVVCKGEPAIKCYGECFKTEVNVVVLPQAASWLLPQHHLTKINPTQTTKRSYLMLTRTKPQTKATKQKVVYVHYDLLQSAPKFYAPFNNIRCSIAPCPLIPLTLNPNCNYFALVRRREQLQQLCNNNTTQQHNNNNNNNNNNTTCNTITYLICIFCP
jgi:hypothetical protein